MISCIICSDNSFFLEKITSSITETIGVPFQILAFRNHEKTVGICQAYNEQARLAKFPYLCFVHEDVLFETQNWGKNAIQHFVNSPRLGLIGVAGSICKSEIISTWFNTANPDLNRYNYKQTSRIDPSKQITMHFNPQNVLLDEVVCLDGVMLLTRKTVWEKYQFDETLLKGFHAYDLDFSIGASNYCQLGVAYDIQINHITDGFANHLWVRDAFKIHKKWKNYLPIYLNDKARLCDNSDSFFYFLQLLRSTPETFWLQVSMLTFFLPRLKIGVSKWREFIIFLGELKKSIRAKVDEKKILGF